MKFGLDKWLLGQCGREDSVGKLARYWVNESGAGRIADNDIWFAELEKSSNWSEAMLDAKREHVIAVDYLSRGKSAPTFPKWFASEENEKQMEQSFATHKNQAKLSADAYLRRLHFGLLKQIEERTLIYLDINHWVNLCHVLVNSHHAREEYAEILFLLDDLVKQGRILCPVSFPLFQELMKQSDSEMESRQD